MTKTKRLSWPPIVDRARQIVDEYDTSVTLRQMFYRLVSEQVLPNTQTAYKQLSSRTAEARRQGGFPDLIDLGRDINRPPAFVSPADAMAALLHLYRRDRTEGQDVSLFLGVEKRGIVEQLSSWFSPMGLPILPLGGYASQTYVDDVVADVTRQDRPGVLIYAGDFDPSGEDIDRDFMARTDCWAKVVRVALSAGQVDEFDLPVNPGKVGDSRAAGFVTRHGSFVQVEVDALPPDTLRGLYAEAIDEFWDVSAYEDCLAREDAGVSALESVAEREGWSA